MVVRAVRDPSSVGMVPFSALSPIILQASEMRKKKKNSIKKNKIKK